MWNIGKVHGWYWSVDEEVDSDLFPALEGQLLLPDAALVPDNSNALILHPRLSAQSPSSVTLLPPKYSEEDCTEERCRFLARLSATYRDWGGYVVNILIYSLFSFIIYSLYYLSDIFLTLII